MTTTYQAGSNTATNGTALGAVGQDIFVKKLIVGLPVANGNVILYNKGAAYSGDAQNIGFKITFPATISYQWTNAVASQTVYDFTGFNNPGMILDGGVLMIDQTMNVTVLWEPAESNGGGQG